MMQISDKHVHRCVIVGHTVHGWTFPVWLMYSEYQTHRLPGVTWCYHMSSSQPLHAVRMWVTLHRLIAPFGWTVNAALKISLLCSESTATLLTHDMIVRQTREEDGEVSKTARCQRRRPTQLPSLTMIGWICCSDVSHIIRWIRDHFHISTSTNNFCAFV